MVSRPDREWEIDERLALRGPTVVLRPPREDDAQAVCEAVRESVAEVGAWLAWCHPAYDRDDALAWVQGSRGARARGEECAFVITDAWDGAVLGGCGLNQVDASSRRANLGYWVRSTATGRGVATQAAGLAAEFGLGVLGLARLEIVAATGNRASQRVAEKLGAVREGVLRARFWIAGEPVDGVLYSLVPGDLERAGRRWLAHPDGPRGPR
ncbi:MAG TPA: GNAT family protein [Acidimicrobiales bacterium]|nr:GNAT family protein [Acidimicrobiales bacterium]